ncbi:DPP IV N-terminal domain-containing protein, partial [Nitrosomonas nitrosa]|uniref:DPP IV N-terminal domain-containing protein n=1 Tax=Nitrosomonas nitrosa TaxID=52442 RepID=UPI0023F78B3A
MSKKSLVRIILVAFLVVGTAVLIRSTVRATLPEQETPPPWLDPENLDSPPLVQNTSQPILSQPEMPAAVVNIPWSKITFQSFRDGNWEVYVGADDGSGQVRLTNNGASDIHPRLNRGTTRIAFASNRDGNYEIYIMATNGSGLTRLTTNTTDDVNPIWSPDGTKIAFQAYRDSQAEIYVMNADGSAQTRLTTDGEFDGTPAWSPDGTKIAFVSRRTGGYRIYTMNANGSGLTQISSQPYSFNPTWSPDGTKIAFDADNDGDGWQDLWVMNNDGSSQQKLYDPYGQTDAWARSWSPDGKYVAFTQISFTQYQGNWYWTYAYLDAQNTGPNYPSQIRLSSSGLDWNPDWQTQDIVPPDSNINPLSAYTKIGKLVISWYGYDNLSGVDHYEVQYHSDTDLAWQSWLTTTESYATFDNGQVGKTYYFRARAVDASKNVKMWDSTATTFTTLYTRQITGQITDNRGTPLSTATLQASPAEVSLTTSSNEGVYHMWLGSFYTHTISITNGSYASLPPTTKWVTDDLTLNYVLPPLNNVIDNSGFEGLLHSSKWQINGVQPPTRIEAASHTGQWAMKLGIPTSQYNFLDGNLCVRPVGDTNKPDCDFTSIQAAVDAAHPNQTIWVFPGEYHEALLMNKSDIALRSVLGPQLTIIDATQLGTAIIISGYWGNTYQNILIEGFTMQNGSQYYNGGGVSITYASNLTLHNNRFINNHGALVGAIGLSNGAESVNIINNWFIDNYTSGASPAQPNCIAGSGNDLLIANNVFWNNDRQGDAAIRLYYSSTGAIYNNTFVGNVGGTFVGCYFDLQNNIIVNSSGTGTWDCTTEPLVKFNNVWNNNPNYLNLDRTGINGNISANPFFDNGFHLRPNSPSLNAGNPDPSFNDPDGSRNDMGAYGGPYAIQEEIDPSAWSHAWYDLSPWSGKTITISFQLKDSLSGVVRSGLSQVVTLTDAIFNPTLSFLYQTGQESTPGSESFVVVIESDTGQSTEFIITPGVGSQLWAFLDEVTLGSGYPDLQVSIDGKESALPGEEEVFTVTYKNQGGVSADGVQVMVTLPNELIFADASITPISTSPLTWNMDDLTPFSEVNTIVVTTTIKASASPFETVKTQ